MTVTIHFHVDEEKYINETHHVILMETEQYYFGTEILTKLTIYEPLKASITSHMPELENRLQSQFYFLEHKDNPNKKRPVYQQYFHKRLKDEKIKLPSYYEVLEELLYTDKGGGKQKVNVVILSDGNIKTAQIEFETKEQAARFAAPNWLIPQKDSVNS